MFMREINWGGVYFSPMLFFVLISLVAAVVLRLIIFKSPLGRFVLQEAWFDVALFCCLLAGVTWLSGSFSATF